MPRNSTEDLTIESNRSSAEIILAAIDEGYIDDNLFWTADRENLPKMSNGTIRGFQSGVVKTAEHIDEEIRMWRKKFPGEFKTLLAEFRASAPPKRRRSRRISKRAVKVNPEALELLQPLPRSCWIIYTALAKASEDKGQCFEIPHYSDVVGAVGLRRASIYLAMNQLTAQRLINWEMLGSGRWKVTICR